MKPLYALTATEAAQAIDSGNTSSEALVTACLERIEQQDTRIKAWAYLDPAQALAQANACDRGASRGLLHGVPVGIKDIIDTCDMPTAYGSQIYAGHQTPWDAACVALLRNAGAVIMGKTVTTELAMYQPGKTANPHNPDHTPGGSSSGSAAAVAAAMVPLALGSQTAGSIIRPASFCGVLGYKASHGDFSLAGVKPLSQTLDTLGGFARHTADLALLRAVLLGTPAHLTELERPPRIGLYQTPQWSQASPATQQALASAGQHLAASGADVRDLELPSVFASLIDAQQTIQVFEGVRCCAYELRMHREQLSPKLLELLDPGEPLSYAAYTHALSVAATCRQHLDEVFATYDVLLVPSAGGEAPSGLHATGDPLFNRMWTLLHTPAINLPGLVGPNGLPVGVQAIGPIGADDRLLASAAWMQDRLT